MSDGVYLERWSDEVECLVLDRPDASVNLLDRRTLDALAARLDQVARTPRRALVVRSAKDEAFVAGADVEELIRLEGEGEVLEIVRLGQEVLGKLASLPVPTVAAIHGACLGGGLELALACDRRVATDAPATRLGLPEVMLGILPAWGGTSRLPRLVGLPRALGIALTGRRLSARQALRAGLVDEVVEPEALEVAALAAALEGRPVRSRHGFLHLAPVARLVGARAGARARARGGGHYPAPEKLAEVMSRGVSRPLDEALALEREAVGALAHTPVARTLLRLFVQRQRLRRAEEDAPPTEPVRRAAVVGAGTMGAGIAQWLATRGLTVLLRDVDPEAVLRGLVEVDRLMDQGVRAHALDGREARRARGRIRPVVGDVPLRRTEVVIEAVPEDLALKRRVFRALEARAGPDTILATNTSSLGVGDVAEGLARPERVAGLHWFHPVHRMDLVEVVVAERTDPLVRTRLVRLVADLGKVPLVVRDRPGFLVNRLLMPYLAEAVVLVSEGVPIERVDRALEAFGMPMGPLRLLDEVGLEVAHSVARHLGKAYGERMPEPTALERLLEHGWKGRKGGAGFYRHERGGRVAANDDVYRAIGAGERRRPAPEEIQERLVLLMGNEAARALDERIVAGAEEVDLAMVIGTGFAPFRGGPLRHMDAVGLPEAAGRLEAFAQAHGARYAPCAPLRDRALAGGSFHGS